MEDLTIQAKTEAFIANLEQAKHATLFNSGVSAISSLLATCETGSTVVVPDDFYSGTRYLMNKCFGERFKYEVIKSDTQLEDLERYLNEGNVSMVMVESPTNPLLQVYDIKNIANIVKNFRKDNIQKPFFVVDTTFCPPIFQNPLNLGADLVMHSATKFLGGHSDALAGVICTNSSDLYKQILATRFQMGNHLEDFTS